MKTLYTAGPTEFEGEVITDGPAMMEKLLKSIIPVFDNTDDLLDNLVSTQGVSNTIVVRLTIETVPFPKRS